MAIREFDDPHLFAAAARGFLETDPFSANVIAVHVEAVVRGLRPHGPADRWWTVDDGGQVAGLAMLTPPHNLFLSRMPRGAAAALAISLAQAGSQLPGVTGEIGSLANFSAAWEARTGRRSRVVLSMQVYRLTSVTVPGRVPGSGRAAEPGDVPQVAAWLAAMHDEAQPHAPVAEDWTQAAGRRVGAGQLRLWVEGGEARSMAGFSSPAAGVSRVGPVYTPPAHRRRGFGTAVSADATRTALTAGATHVMLYADLANPTSNSIYQLIGYQPDHQAQERAFVP